MNKKRKKNSVCAGCVLFRLKERDNIDFLMVKHAQETKERWCFPKGHMEKDESIEETAVREFYEETGAVARLLYELPPVFTTNKYENKVVHFFLAKQLYPNIPFKIQEDEIKDIKWFSINKLPLIYKYQQPIVRYANNIIKKLL